MLQYFAPSPSGLLTARVTLIEGEVFDGNKVTIVAAIPNKYIIPITFAMFPSPELLLVAPFTFGDAVNITNNGSLFLGSLPLFGLADPIQQKGYTGVLINSGTYDNNLVQGQPLALSLVISGAGQIAIGSLQFLVSYFVSDLTF